MGCANQHQEAHDTYHSISATMLVTWLLSFITIRAKLLFECAQTEDSSAPDRQDRPGSSANVAPLRPHSSRCQTLYVWKVLCCQAAPTSLNGGGDEALALTGQQFNTVGKPRET